MLECGGVVIDEVIFFVILLFTNLQQSTRLRLLDRRWDMSSAIFLTCYTSLNVFLDQNIQISFTENMILK